MHILRPRRRMQELVQKLKSHGYCVYYLSNIPEDVLDLLMERDMKGLFDGGVASCEVHINKPDPRIYQASSTTGWTIFRPRSRSALPASR